MFGWFEALIVGAVTGLTDILPVSLHAHRRLLLKMIGTVNIPPIMSFLMHLGILAALYLACQTHILKMTRAIRLSRVPKRKRKRPLDMRSLMDFRLWRTMLLPVILVLFFYQKISGMVSNQILMATFLFLNGLILYIPQFLPSSNKDCRNLSRVEGLLMGLGGALFAVPGFSGVGVSLSVASVTGVERRYALGMVFLMNMGITVGRMVYDIKDMLTTQMGPMSLSILLCYLFAAVASFLAASLAIRILRSLAEEKGFTIFSYYCWGIALFTFILSLMA